jgi:PhnB protein
MADTVNAVPEGFHTLTAHLRVRGAAEAIDFYKRAFGAEEICRMPGPGDTLMHAELSIGNSRFMLCDEFPDWGALSPKSLNGTGVTLHLYVGDVDAVFNRAVDAGATVKMAVQNAFWGDRYGQIVDPYGHEWSIATHIEDVVPEEMETRAAAAMGEMG